MNDRLRKEKFSLKNSFVSIFEIIMSLAWSQLGALTTVKNMLSEQAYGGSKDFSNVSFIKLRNLR